ncbi:Uncharacterised protein [uncultured archaeon]|nr:Uncharacterised protein [uncultured archaeon]
MLLLEEEMRMPYLVFEFTVQLMMVLFPLEERAIPQ